MSELMSELERARMRAPICFRSASVILKRMVGFQSHGFIHCESPFFFSFLLTIKAGLNRHTKQAGMIGICLRISSEAFRHRCIGNWEGYDEKYIFLTDSLAELGNCTEIPSLL